MFILVVGLIYYFVPNTQVRLRDVWFGAILAGAAVARSRFAGFAWYVRDLSRFSVHGSVAAVVVFLVWVYLSAVILLYGVEVTAAYARLRKQARSGTPEQGLAAPGPRPLAVRRTQRGSAQAEPDTVILNAQSSRARAQSVSSAAREQSGGLVPVGRRGVRAGAARREADLSVDRLLDLPLVPRDGARVVRGRRDRGRAQSRTSCRSRSIAKSGRTSIAST